MNLETLQKSCLFFVLLVLEELICRIQSENEGGRGGIGA